PLISARLDGELPPEDAGALDAHLAACPVCQAAAEAFRLQHADLRRAFVPRRAAAARVAERVIERLHAAPPPVRPRSRPRWLPLVLSAAAGFLLAVGVFRPWQRPQVVEVPVKSDPPPRPALQLTLATGAVDVQAPGQEAWQPLPSGGTVEA